MKMTITTKTLRMSAMIGLAFSVVTGTIATAQKRTVPSHRSAVTSPATQGHFSVPSSAFTPWVGSRNYSGNQSGTARFFAYSQVMFAPVNLPGNSVVTSFSCGGAHPKVSGSIKFTLRRNNPQQANVDMAIATTDRARTGFQRVRDSSITSAKIDNGRYNYYIVAERAGAEDFGNCPKCSIAFCRISYVH